MGISTPTFNRLRGAVAEPIYAQAGEGDQIFHFSAVGRKTVSTACPIRLTMIEPTVREDKYAERSEVADIHTAETSLLRIVTHETQPLRPVLDNVGNDGSLAGDPLDR